MYLNLYILRNIMIVNFNHQVDLKIIHFYNELVKYEIEIFNYYR